MRRVLLIVVAGVLSCGDDPHLTVPRDGEVVTGRDAGIDGVLADPGAFDHSECTGEGSLREFDFAGIWHLDLHFDEYDHMVGPLLIVALDGGYRITLFGRLTDSVVWTADDLFARKQWTSAQGYQRVVAIDICAVDGAGQIVGRYGSCRDGECFRASFTGLRVDPLPGPVATNMSLLAEYNGPATAPWSDAHITVNVQQHAGVAYLARYGDGLRIVDASDPRAPFARGHSPVAVADREVFNDVKIIETDARVFALMASNLRGVVVVDVTDPDAPQELTDFPNPQNDDPTVNVHTLFVEGTRAYLANVSTAGIDIFDVADPTAPVRLGSWYHPDVGVLGGYVHDLFVANGRVYLNYWNLGMVIVDTAVDPAAPTLVGQFDSYERRTSHSCWVTAVGGRTVAVHGDEDYGAHVRIIDVDPTSVEFLNVLAEFSTRPQVSVHNVMAIDGLAYITYYQDGLWVLDLADPKEPVVIAAYQTWPAAGRSYGSSMWEGAIGVDVDAATGLIYVADTHRGLFILRLNDR